MKIRGFWDVDLTMEAVRASETSVYSNETTWRYIPEGSNLLSLNDCADFGTDFIAQVNKYINKKIDKQVNK
jgi:hypothetical protein